FVGKSTAETLRKFGIKTIGDLACSDEALICRILGKRGRQLRIYARGEDDEPVRSEKKLEDLKSIGNSTTLPKNVTDREEIKRWFYALSESVSTRLREADVGRASTVHIVVRNEMLEDTTCQTKVTPTALCGDIAKTAYELFCKHFPVGTSVRMIGVTVSGFDYHVEQIRLDGFGEEKAYEKKERAESAVFKLREKYGYVAVQRGLVLEDKTLNGLDIYEKKEERKK
ncbi:MAG: hypothetical protein IJF64_01445, partial [Clostridia bacterium]|nr:hypothetical protein [Clostridia bacterium]